MRRQPEHGAGPDNRARGRRREVILADVHSVGAREPGDVRPVVDDEDGARRVRDLPDARRELEEGGPGEGLGANLQEPRAAVQVRGREIDRRPSRAPGRVHVDNRVQAEIWKEAGAHPVRLLQRGDPEKGERGSAP
jgi:hypothetical protein